MCLWRCKTWGWGERLSHGSTMYVRLWGIQLVTASERKSFGQLVEDRSSVHLAHKAHPPTVLPLFPHLPTKRAEGLWEGGSLRKGTYLPS